MCLSWLLQIIKPRFDQTAPCVVTTILVLSMLLLHFSLQQEFDCWTILVLVFCFAVNDFPTQMGSLTWSGKHLYTFFSYVYEIDAGVVFAQYSADLVWIDIVACPKKKSCILWKYFYSLFGAGGRGGEGRRGGCLPWRVEMLISVCLADAGICCVTMSNWTFQSDQCVLVN